MKPFPSNIKCRKDRYWSYSGSKTECSLLFLLNGVFSEMRFLHIIFLVYVFFFLKPPDYRYAITCNFYDLFAIYFFIKFVNPLLSLRSSFEESPSPSTSFKINIIHWYCWIAKNKVSPIFEIQTSDTVQFSQQRCASNTLWNKYNKISCILVITITDKNCYTYNKWCGWHIQ